MTESAQSYVESTFTPGPPMHKSVGIDGQCSECGVPASMLSDLGCLQDGDTLRTWYERLALAVRFAKEDDATKAWVRAFVTPENFHHFYRPAGDRLVLRPDAPPKMTPSGLWYPPSFIQDMQYKRPVKGTVMACGPGMLTYVGGRWPLCSEADTSLVVPGARVLFHPQGGFEVVKVGNEVFMSVRDDLVIALIVEE